MKLTPAELYKDPDGGFRWRLSVSWHGADKTVQETVVDSPPFPDEASARQSLIALVRAARQGIRLNWGDGEK